MLIWRYGNQQLAENSPSLCIHLSVSNNVTPHFMGWSLRLHLLCSVGLDCSSPVLVEIRTKLVPFRQSDVFYFLSNLWALLGLVLSTLLFNLNGICPFMLVKCIGFEMGEARGHSSASGPCLCTPRAGTGLCHNHCIFSAWKVREPGTRLWKERLHSLALWPHSDSLSSSLRWRK